MSNPPREWRFYVDDMIAFAEKVLAYTNSLDQAQFATSGLNYDATLAQSGLDWRSRNTFYGIVAHRLK